MTDLRWLPAELNIQVPTGDVRSFALAITIDTGSGPVAAPWASHALTSAITKSGQTATAWTIVTGADGAASVTLPSGLAQGVWRHHIAFDGVDILAGQLWARAAGTPGTDTPDVFTITLDQSTLTLEVTITPWNTGGAGGGAVDSVNGETGTVVLTAGDIGFTPVGTIAATTTQAAVAEVATDAAAALSAHEADATNVHGIANMAALETTAGAQAKADGAQAAAIAASLGATAAAGGVLSGNYPNPTFAADMATQVELNAFAPLASPGLTGVPTAPTAAPGTNTTQVATTAFVAAATPDLSETMGFIAHGANATETRPSGFGCVTWIGSVEPVNAINDDVWLEIA